jgi:hypothetical protein
MPDRDPIYLHLTAVLPACIRNQRNQDERKFSLTLSTLRNTNIVVHVNKRKMTEGDILPCSGTKNAPRYIGP